MTDFIRNQLDFLTGALYGVGSILAQANSANLNLFKVALNTIVVTLVAYIVKESAKWVHEKYIKKNED